MEIISPLRREIKAQTYVICKANPLLKEKSMAFLFR